MLFSSMIVIQDTTGKLENSEEPMKEEEEEEIKPQVEVPYPDKYLEKFKSMSFDNESLDLESLKNSIVVEHTPLGNVAMHYDIKREAFVYYSDSVMPYRYLEVVARKYVITFHCKRVFVDMEDEINKAKTKIEEQKNAKKQEEAEKQAQENDSSIELKEEPKKKNVFANFKTYNKNTTKDSSNKPTTGNSTATNSDNKKTEDIILKENANHYTCDGRYSNFIVLKKVDKTLVDKRLKMSFADFKKMQAKKTSS